MGQTQGPGAPSPAAHRDGRRGLRPPHPSGPALSRGMSHHPPSFTMPTARHFWKRQNWQRFRRLLSTGQSLLARQMYLAFFCTVRWRGGNTEQAVRACGEGEPGGGGLSRSCCHPRQKHSLFTAIFLTFGWQGRERWRVGGEGKSWGHWGRLPHQEEDP